ncbi:MAG: S41 family peptidase [Candidatus Brocadiia bacterium]
MRRRELLWLSVIAVLVVLQAAPAANEEDASYEKYKRFVAVLEQVKRHYVRPVEEEKLFLGAYKGMLAELDPYSQYMTAEDIQQLQVDTEGEFGGLGIEITLDQNNILTVITPLEDTPAMRAGVLPGDRIIEIEGESTYNMTLMDAVKRLRGKPGTKVTITVIHENRPGREKLTITRDIITVHSVRAAKMVDEKAKIGYVRMSNFQKTTPEELKDAVDGLREDGMQALIIDLRRNPGGLLDSAVKVTDLFIESGVIVSTKGRTPDTVHRFAAHQEGTFPDFPLALLTSNYSASGSEIFAGAVQDHRRGILVGTRTFGKGSVQSILPVDGGARLRLTTARYYTPSGRMIHRERGAKEEEPWGIQPDIEVETTYEEELGLLEHWREERVEENVEDDLPEQPDEPLPQEDEGEGEKEEFVDRTLNSAIDALKAVLVYRKR